MVMRLNPNKYLFSHFMGIGEAVLGAVIGGVASGVVSSAMGGSSGGGSSGGSQGGTAGYTPLNASGVDTKWNELFATGSQNALQGQQEAYPSYLDSYKKSMGINYDPYQQAANQAGGIYGNMANIAGQQVGGFGQAAQLAQQQQQQLYGANQNILNAAQDPRNELYSRTQQQLTDQVRAGQAARGLGNSPVGAAEENQAMSNFNIDWQNQQLARQAQGLGAASTGANAALGQGNLYNTMQGAQLTAGGNQAQYTGQSAQYPLNAQREIASMPAANASSYLTGISGMNGLLAGQTGQALPYMNAGIGATQYNATNQISQNQGMGRLFGQAAGQIGNALFGGSNNSGNSGNSGGYYGSGGYGNAFGVNSQIDSSGFNPDMSANLQGMDTTNYGFDFSGFGG